MWKCISGPTLVQSPTRITYPKKSDLIFEKRRRKRESLILPFVRKLIKLQKQMEITIYARIHLQDSTSSVEIPTRAFHFFILYKLHNFRQVPGINSDMWNKGFFLLTSIYIIEFQLLYTMSIPPLAFISKLSKDHKPYQLQESPSLLKSQSWCQHFFWILENMSQFFLWENNVL